MKAKIHPKYNEDCKVTCACGNTFTTGSILKKIEVEICANCHPFYTGQTKYIDTEGRIEKFERKRKAVAQKVKSTTTKKKTSKKAK